MNTSEQKSNSQPEQAVTPSAPSIIPGPDRADIGFFVMGQQGWIKIHRSIEKHWIWNNPQYLKGWLCILIEVNHEPRKVLIEKELIECGRGQSLNSLTTWTRLFGLDWTINKTRTFLNLLTNDSMINTEGLRKTTRLTVCNYDKYQSQSQGEQSETTDKAQADHKQTTSRPQTKHRQTTTNKNVKNDNNEKELKEGQELNTISDTGNSIHKLFIEIYSDWYKSKVGVDYKFNGGQDGKAVKDLLIYITNQVRNKKGDEPTNDEILDAFRFILNSYQKWNKFYQGQLKLSQINSNLSNIMADIKGVSNGKPSAEERTANIMRIIQEQR